ncbi:MAG: solute:sodium symporter family transporter, partial [Planctomycetota bacterium]
CSFVVAVLAVIAAPRFYGQEQLFGYFQKLNGIYFIPLLAIILVGMVNKRVDGRSAFVTLVLGLVAMVIGTFFTGGDDGWLETTFKSGYHYMGAVFVSLIVLQLVLGAVGMKRDTPYEQQDAKAVDLTPWGPAPVVGGALCLLAIGLYAFFAL